MDRSCGSSGRVLFPNCESLSSKPSPTKKKEEKRGGREEEETETHTKKAM
jgi:hypothetical protein